MEGIYQNNARIKTHDRNSGTRRDKCSSAQDHLNGRAFTVCNSYGKFCLREPSQILRNANCFKSYLLPVHPTPNCMPKKGKPWQHAMYKMLLPLLKAPLQAEDHRGEQDAREKYCSKTLRCLGIGNFCSSHTPTLSRSYCSANCRYRNDCK